MKPDMTCEYCGSEDHFVGGCPDLTEWRERQDIEDMAAEAAYWNIPGAAESF